MSNIKLIKESGEPGDSLIQLARKLQQRSTSQAEIHEEPLEDLDAMQEKLPILHIAAIDGLYDLPA